MLFKPQNDAEEREEPGPGGDSRKVMQAETKASHSTKQGWKRTCFWSKRQSRKTTTSRYFMSVQSFNLAVHSTSHHMGSFRRSPRRPAQQHWSGLLKSNLTAVLSPDTCRCPRRRPSSKWIWFTPGFNTNWTSACLCWTWAMLERITRLSQLC